MSKTENALKDLFGALIASGEKEAVEIAEKLFDAGIISPERIEKIQSVEEFYFALMYPYNKFLDGFVAIRFNGDRKARWLFTHHGYIENHFQKIIIQHEGSPCCADKSKTIVESIARFLLKGTEIVWDYSQEYTFHLPKKVFATHSSIIDFYDALVSLYYGNNEKYLEYLLTRKYIAP